MHFSTSTFPGRFEPPENVSENEKFRTASVATLENFTCPHQSSLAFVTTRRAMKECFKKPSFWWYEPEASCIWNILTMMSCGMLLFTMNARTYHRFFFFCKWDMSNCERQGLRSLDAGSSALVLRHKQPNFTLLCQSKGFLAGFSVWIATCFMCNSYGASPLLQT